MFHRVIYPCCLFFPVFLFSHHNTNPTLYEWAVVDYAESYIIAGGLIFLGWLDSNSTNTGNILSVGGMLVTSALNSGL